MRFQCGFAVDPMGELTALSIVHGWISLGLHSGREECMERMVRSKERKGGDLHSERK